MIHPAAAIKTAIDLGNRNPPPADPEERALRERLRAEMKKAPVGSYLAVPFDGEGPDYMGHLYDDERALG